MPYCLELSNVPSEFLAPVLFLEMINRSCKMQLSKFAYMKWSHLTSKRWWRWRARGCGDTVGWCLWSDRRRVCTFSKDQSPLIWIWLPRNYTRRAVNLITTFDACVESMNIYRIMDIYTLYDGCVADLIFQMIRSIELRPSDIYDLRIKSKV